MAVIMAARSGAGAVMGRRIGTGVSVLLALVAIVGFAAGTAGADTVGTTVNVAPSTNLAATQNVAVSGTGFGLSQPGTIRQAIQIGQNEYVSAVIGNFTTNASGAFVPTSVPVKRTFITTGNQSVTCSASQPCSILAATTQTAKDDHASISFFTTSAATCQKIQADQAAFNAKITASINALPADLSPSRKAAAIAALEASRTQGNAKFAAASAAAGC